MIIMLLYRVFYDGMKNKGLIIRILQYLSNLLSNVKPNRGLC